MGGVTPEIHLFITGGWDSTFMLCKLSRQDITICPVYVLNPKRKSNKKELEAAKKIIQALSKHPGTKAKIKKLDIRKLPDIKVDQNFTAARHRIMEKVGLLGYQYDYLATVAKDIGTIGLGIEKDSADHEVGASAALNHLATLKPSKYGHIVDEKKSDPDIYLLFGRIFFPIINTTEVEMVDWAKKYGYTNIMSLTWFCHSPIKNQPCGLCRPCEEKIDSKMGFLLPEEAIKRYNKARKWNHFGGKVSRTIKNFILFFLSDKPKSHK